MHKYTFNNNTYFATPKDNPKDLVSKEIGDSKQADFHPQQKICRWDNECNVSVRLIHDEKNPKVSTDGEKVMWKGDKIEARFYDIPDSEGASEFEVILKEKPATNKVEFTLVDKDVDYFYQPELTADEIKQGASRPENVVGSYAIYAKTPKTNWTGGKEYKCGKIGHIYRPKIIDSAGTEVWGDLHIENGILSVTIPQEFLDNAVYPVRHAAGLTFGYTTKGGSNRIAGDTQFGSFFTSGGSGTMTSITAWLGGYEDVPPNWGQNVPFIFGIYNGIGYWDGDNYQYTLLKVTSTGSKTNVNDEELTLNLTSNLTISNQSYLLDFLAEPQSGVDPTWYGTYCLIYFDTGGAGQGMVDDGDYNSGFMNPYFDWNGYTAKKFSIYATYTAGGGTVYTFDTLPATFSLTGQGMGNNNIRNFACLPATFTLTGIGMGIKKIWKFATAPASFILTGMAMGLKKIWKFATAPASFILTGMAMGLKKIWKFATAPASFILTGMAMGLKKIWKFATAPASFVLTGMSVGMKRILNFATLPATFVMTGIAISWKKIWNFVTLPASYIITGMATAWSTTIKMVYTFVCLPASYAVKGLDLILKFSTTWSFRSKSNTDWTNKSQNSTDWTMKDKPSTDWTMKAKNDTSWTNKPKNDTTWQQK